MVSSSFCLASVRENNWKNVCWKTALFPYFVLTRIMKGGESIHIMSWLYIYIYILRCHVFPMVSALNYSLLKLVVKSKMICNCQRDMLRQGGSWLF